MNWNATVGVVPLWYDTSAWTGYHVSVVGTFIRMTYVEPEAMLLAGMTTVCGAYCVAKSDSAIV